jgi:outer membrane autotransporter protein
MLCRSFSRRLLQIVAILALVNFFSFAVAEPASAQSVVSTSYNSTTGILTVTDAAGNSYLVNLSAFSTTSKNDVSGNFIPAGGTSQPANFVIVPLGGGQFTINGIPANQKLVSCSASTSSTTVTTIVFLPPSDTPTPVTTTTITYPASCYVTDTPRALLASIKQELRSQSNAVIGSITDRLRALAQDLAESSAASVETPPGGTVILNNFSSTQPPKYNGLSAGSDGVRWGVWADASGSDLKNDNPADAFYGPSVVALTGLDYVFDRRWIFGVAAGYTHADLALSPSTINREVDGAVVGPYAAYIVNSNWWVDGLVNWTSLSNDITAPLPFPAGSYHSNRVTAASNLNYFTRYEGIKLTGFGGYAYSWEGGNTNAILPSALANNIRYGAIRIGGEAAYPFGAFEPYLPLRVEYETTTPNDGTSRTALVAGAGLRYRWSDTLTGGLLFETTELKTHTRDLIISGHLRWSF